MTVTLPVKGSEDWDVSLNAALTQLDNNTTAAVNGALLVSNNLSDLSNKATARTNLGLTGLANSQSNLTATTNPTSGSDNTQGYSLGSTWVNTSTNAFFVCVNASTGAAVWIQIPAGYVDTTSNQTVAGTKTFTGMIIGSRSADSSAFSATYSATNTSNAAFSFTANASTGRMLGSTVTGDSTGRYVSLADGSATYGSGSVSRDTSTGRASAGTYYSSPNLLVGASTDLGDNGVGVLKLANASTVPTGTPPTGGSVMVSSSGQPGYVNPHGLNPNFSGGISAVISSSSVTTTGLQALITGSIPANDPQTGAVYEMTGYGVFTSNATATTVASGLYWGTTSGTALATLAASSLTASLTNAPFRIKTILTFRSATSVVAEYDFMIGTSSTTGSGSGVTGISTAAVTVVTSSANTLTFAINLNNAQTFTLLGGDLRRIR